MILSLGVIFYISRRRRGSNGPATLKNGQPEVIDLQPTEVLDEQLYSQVNKSSRN
jgi:hypothetical protein